MIARKFNVLDGAILNGSTNTMRGLYTFDKDQVGQPAVSSEPMFKDVRIGQWVPVKN